MDGATGVLLWRWLAPDTGDPIRGVTGAIAAADVDGDGALEVSFLGLDGVVYALDNDCN